MIHQWHDESPEFHNLLALQYKDKVVSLMEEYLQNLPEGILPCDNAQTILIILLKIFIILLSVIIL